MRDKEVDGAYMEVRTEIEIGARAEKAWLILADLESYAIWNPFITKMTGKLEPGATLEGESNGEKSSLTVLRVELNREIRLWTRFMPGLDGEHIFAIEPISDDRMLFRQDFYYRGTKVTEYAKQLEMSSRRDAEAMNAALKKRAKHRSRRGTGYSRRYSEKANPEETSLGAVVKGLNRGIEFGLFTLLRSHKTGHEPETRRPPSSTRSSCFTVPTSPESRLPIFQPREARLRA